MSSDGPLVSGVLEAEGQKILEGFTDVELDPASIDVLYHANQLVLSKAQRAVVIESIRRHRAERIEKSRIRAAKKQKKTPEELSGLSLDDLGELEP